MKNMNSLSNRIIALLLCMVMVLSMLPTGVLAEETGSQYATVEAITEGVTVEQSADKVSAVFAGKLNWVAKDPSIGRDYDGWWVGIKVIAPETVNMELATYSRKGVVTKYSDKCEGDGSYVTLWGLVNEEYLRSANLTDGLSTYSWEFDWDGTGEHKQTVVLDIDADQTVLLAQDGTCAYPAAAASFGTLEMLTPGATITGNDSANVVASYQENITLEWVAADPSVGRMQDGWWIGMKINAPQVDLQNVHFTVRNTAKEFWKCKDSADDAQTHYMTIWVCVNELASGTMEPRQYGFDWNNDGLYEQTVTLKLDPAFITLEKDGVQVYPKLGMVYPYTNATVTNNESGRVEVRVENASISWSEIDEQAGRMTKAWWVGINVQAPEGMSSDALANVLYQAKKDKNAAWEDVAERSFASDRDTEDSMQIWFSLTPAALAESREKGEDITRYYRFNWDGQGDYDQEIIFSVAHDGDIQLNAVDQTGFGFPEDIAPILWIGKTDFSALATGGQGDGSITYSVVSGSAEVDPQTGVITPKGVGPVKIRATKAADTEGFYNEAIDEYTITIQKNLQEASFTNPNPGPVTYAPGLVIPNPVTNVKGGAEVSYKIIEEDLNGAGVAKVDGEGNLTVLKAGTVTVQANIGESGLYDALPLTYTLVINKADQPDFAVVDIPDEITWQKEDLAAFKTTGTLGNGKLVWTPVEDETNRGVAKIHEDGTITLKKAGLLKFEVKNKGDECYNDSASIPVVVRITKAEQKDFAFAETETVELTYNDFENFYKDNTASGGQSEGTVTYSVISGDAASVNGTTGAVTLLHAGTVTIRADKAGDDRYKPTYDEYDLIIAKDDQPFAFEKGETVEIVYGQIEYDNAVQFTGNYSEDSELTYTLEPNDLGATIDAKTGKITFGNSQGKVGTLTVNADKAGDECYNAYPLSYTLKVDYLKTYDQPQPDGDLKNDSGWYTGNVYILAPEGYTISTKNDLENNTWSDRVPFDAEGADQTAVVYLKNSKGSITDAVSVGGINIDTGNPTDLKITYTAPSLQVMLEDMTFGICKAKTLMVTVSAADENSGIDKLVITTADGEVTVPGNGAESASHSFEIKAEHRHQLVLKAVDVAGRATELKDDQTLILDTKHPKLTAGYEYASGQHNESGDKYYTQGDVHITFSIDEANFDLNNLAILGSDGEMTAMPVVLVNSWQQDVVWTKNEVTNKWDGKLTISGDGDYTVEVTYTDPAGNAMTAYRQGISINSKASRIDVNYAPETVYNDCYYNADRTATLVINEHNFDAKDVKVTVSAKDIFDETIVLNDNFATFACTNANWEHKGDVHTLKPMTFTQDGIYTVEVAYTNLNGTAAQKYTETFVIDHEAPQNVQISYNEPVAQKIIEGLTFGFYQAKAEITVTATDTISAVEHFVLSYRRDENATDHHLASFNDLVLNEVKVGETADTFSATYTLPAQARGNFTVYAVNKAAVASDYVTDQENMIVTDTVEPGIRVEFTHDENSTTRTFRDGITGAKVDTVDQAGQIFYNGKATATVIIDEPNFFEGRPCGANNDQIVHNVYLTVTRIDDDENVTVTEYLCEGAEALGEYNDLQTITWTSLGDSHSTTITFEEDGDYVLNLDYADFSENSAVVTGNGFEKEPEEVSYTSKTITVDQTAPVIDISYDKNNALNGDCYQANRIPSIQVTEHNFRPEEFDFILDYDELTYVKDILGNSVEVADFDAYAKNPDHWTTAGNVHTLNPEFSVDGIYSYNVDYTDKAGNNDGDRQPEQFTIDHKGPVNIRFAYSTPVLSKIINKLTFGFYQAEMEVTVIAQDNISGVDYFLLSYTRDPSATDYHMESFEDLKLTDVKVGDTADSFSATYTLPLEARGSFSVEAYDRAGNMTAYTDENSMIVTDKVSPTVDVVYTHNTEETIKTFRNGEAGPIVATIEEADRIFYNGEATATITIQEPNFFEGMPCGEENEQTVHGVILTVTRTDDNGNVTVTEYLCEGADALTDCDAQQIIAWTHDGDVHSTSITFAEDGDYVLELNYVDFSGNGAAFNANGYEAEPAYITYTSKIITVDKTAPVIDITYDNNAALNGDCYQANRIAAIQVTEHNFRPEEFDFVLDNDAHTYVKDIQGNQISVADFDAYARDPENWTSVGNVHTLNPEFSVDGIYSYNVDYTDMAGNNDGEREAESFVVDHDAPTEITISYSTPVLAKIISSLTFGCYQAEMEVTVAAKDITSGVDYFLLSYTRDPSATDYHMDSFEDLKLTDVKTGETAESFSATYTLPLEARGSFSVKVFDRAGNQDSYTDTTNMIVTDQNEPGIEVSFAPKEETTTVHFVDANVKDVETFEQAANAFYNGNVIATVVIEEENFFEGLECGEENDDFIHEVVLTVTRTDDNNATTVTEYLCQGATQRVPGASVRVIDWKHEEDTHTVSIEFAQDGDYVLDISYTDFSGNEAAINGNDGVGATKSYTSKVITVDKTMPVINVEYGNTNVVNLIDERSYFESAQSAVIAVTEHNFRAEDVAAVVTAKDYLGNDVAVANFAAQLADEKNWTHNGNVHTAKVNYTVDANYTFDVDFEDLALNASADYQEDLFTVDTVAPTDLTVSYSTSVLNENKDSYYNAPMTVTITARDATSGIYHFAYSYVNAAGVSKVNAQLLDQAIQAAEIRYENGKAIATFKIPKSALGQNNQFNGTVRFTAYDRSEYNTELVDNTRIIVDNITPTATITYNTPVSQVNNTSYYGGNINGSIVINEANFDAADTVVTVTRNGSSYPVKVAWTNNSADRHTGTFTLTEDGDYYVSVNYKDKSGNQMKAYKSNELTLDTQAPSIKVSNIKANSANKDEQYGFVIEISDINLDAASMKPVLKAVKKNAQGVYETMEIELGEPTVVTANQTYTYTVENLAEDALYTLTCEASDRSANKFAQIVLEDGNSYDEVPFSINREGSTFGYGNEFAQNLVDQYYVYSVTEDLVLVEINVDPIENYTVSLNGTELQEGTDYTTEQSSKPGEWSKRTYTIKKENFVEEGEYNIIVNSTDKTNTTAFSDVKNLDVAFVVDQTKPVITITGLESGGRYQTELQNVTLVPTDEGGRLNSLKVTLLSSDGEPLVVDGENVSVRFDLAGEELRQYLLENDGKVTFTIPTSLNSMVKIICNDCAVNEENLTNEEIIDFNRITVSENWFVIFFANTPVFAGTVAGILGLIGLIIFLIKRKKDKNNKAKAKA